VKESAKKPNVTFALKHQTKISAEKKESWPPGFPENGQLISSIRLGIRARSS
jgi:hypothetical protein